MDNQRDTTLCRERLGSYPSTDRTTNQYQSGTEGGAIRRVESRPVSAANSRTPSDDHAPRRSARLSWLSLDRYPVHQRSDHAGGLPALELFGESAGYVRTTTGRLQKEASATIVWETLAARNFVPLLWAAFPFHPPSSDEPRSNRAPTARELALGRPFWLDLAQLMGIEVIVAVGNHAAQSMAIAGLERSQDPSSRPRVANRNSWPESTTCSDRQSPGSSR